MSAGPDLVAALLPVIEAFDRLQVAYQVAGSVASSVHGMARATMDIDLVADLEPGHVDDLVAALVPEYYAEEGMIREALRERSCFNLIHQASMLKVGVFVLKNRPYDRQALARRRPDRIEDETDTRVFFVTTPEDIVLAKLEWFDRGGSVSERQWNDLLGVLRVQDQDIDVKYLRRWAPELGVADLLEKALEER